MLGNYTFIVIRVGGLSTFYPTLNNVVKELLVGCTHISCILQLRFQSVVVGISILFDAGSPMHIPVWRINYVEVLLAGSTYKLSFLTSLGNGERPLEISSCLQVWCTDVLAPLPVYDVKCLFSCTEVTERALSFSKQLVVSEIHLKLF